MLNFSNYDKTIVMVCTLVVSLGAILAGPDVGLPASWVKYIALAVAIAGAILHFYQPNKNQPTLPPGHSIVANDDVKPGARIVASR